MATAYIPTGQHDVVDEPQYDWEESHSTASNFGTTRSTPTFLPFGRDAEAVFQVITPGGEIQNLGDYDPTGDTGVLTKHGFVTVTTKIVNSTVWKAVTNTPNGSETMDDSMVILMSRMIGTTETWFVASGCKAESATLRITKDDSIVMEIRFRAKTITQTTTDPLASGTPATIPSTEPWKHDSGGSGPFIYNSSEILTRGMTITVTWTYAPLDPDGDQEDLYSTPTGRRIRVSVNVFVSGTTIFADAVARTARTVTRVLKSATSTITFTRWIWENYEEGYSRSQNGATIVTLEAKVDAIATT